MAQTDYTRGFARGFSEGFVEGFDGQRPDSESPGIDDFKSGYDAGYAAGFAKGGEIAQSRATATSPD